MDEYPDPRRIPYPTTQPPRFAPQMTTQDQGPRTPVHWHCAVVDLMGDGVTSTEDSHFHYVKRRQILPAAGHTHEFAGLPCGAGGVRPMTIPASLGIYGMGAAQSTASGSRQAEIALRRARVRINFADQALRRYGGCNAAQESLNDAKEWISTAMRDRRLSGIAPVDRSVQALMLDVVRVQNKIRKKCRRG